MTTLSPELIQIAINDEDGWVIDEAYSSDDDPERTVLYYIKLLKPGETTTLFVTAVSVDREILEKTDLIHNSETNVTRINQYDGLHLCLEATVNGVQSHNGADAALSAWGRSVTVDEEAGTLTLN